VLSHVGTLAPPGEYELNLCFLRLTRVHNPNGKSISSAVSVQLVAESPYTLQLARLSPKIAAYHGGICIHIKFMIPWASPSNSPNDITICSAVFTQVTAQCHILYNLATPSPLKIAPSHGVSGPQCNTWYPGPTKVLNSNGISIGSAVFAGLSSVTDRPTDQSTWLVTIDRIYVRSTGDTPNNM